MFTQRLLAGLACVIAASAVAPVAQSAPPSGLAFQQAATSPRITGTEYRITGINAWSEAAKTGFHFRPTAGADQRVTSPHDGVATYLQRSWKDPVGVTRWENIAAITGGAMSVYRPPSGSRTVTFNMFLDRVLSPGWTIVSVDQQGGTWDRKPAAGSNDLSMRITVTAYADRIGSAQLGSIVLRGPDGQAWTRAFEGRKLFTVTGINAWNAAKGYGFTFQPLKERDDEEVSNALDGVDTWIRQLGRRCDRSDVVARVVGGNMVAHCASYVSQTSTYDMTRDFRMFGGKRLAPGWTVRDVVVSGGSWVRRPVAGSDNLEFVYRVSLPNTGTPQDAIVTSVVLEGPTSASSYQDAFKVK